VEPGTFLNPVESPALKNHGAPVSPLLTPIDFLVRLSVKLARRESPAVNAENDSGLDSFSADLQRKLSSSQIPALHGIRAIAVFLVILYHFGLPFPGAHGVLIFFVLSGFLITWLLLKEHERSGSISLKGFYKRRILRIFPAFYFYWAVLVSLLLITGKNILWPHAVSSLFYLSNYYNAIFGDPNNGLSHTWSLAIEEQFYLLWPFVFSRLAHDLKKMTIVLIGIIGGVWVYRCILLFVFHVDQAYFYAAFDTRLDSLMMGCLLAVLMKRRVLMSVWRNVSRSPVLPLSTCALFVASIFAGPALIPRYRDFIGFAVDPVLVAILIVQLIALSSTAYFGWLDWRPVRFLGDISYSLYLWQQLTLGLTSHLQFPMLARLSIALALTIMVASVSYYAVERPFLRLKNASLKPGTWFGKVNANAELR
jgi:peptidoglycan/LPS O-acetylase OafA/YrhL